MRPYIPRNPSRGTTLDTPKRRPAREKKDSTLESVIARLRKYHDQPVDDPKRADDVKLLTATVNKLYNTKAYEGFYQLIINQFSDLRHVSPGTIGAYCYGCNLATASGGVEANCGPLCAGGIPPPSLPAWAKCGNHVILLHVGRNNSGEVRTYQVINHAPKSTHCYVFVLRDGTHTADVVLTEQDFKTWYPLRVESYQLFEYNGGECRDLTGTITVSVPLLASPKNVPVPAQETNHPSGAVIGALIVLVLLVFLLHWLSTRTH